MFPPVGKPAARDVWPACLFVRYQTLMTRNDTPKKREWKPAFIAALRETGNVRRAAEAAGIAWKTAYREREKAKRFREEWDDALGEATDLLEEEARRRAVEGLVRYKFHQGAPVLHPETHEPYYELEYSDTLLIFLLKAHRPEMFRERYEHVHSGGDKPIEIVAIEAVKPEESDE